MELIINKLEKAVMNMLLDGEVEELGVLRGQFVASKVTNRKLTGVGFFLDFQVPEDSPSVGNKEFQLGDVEARIKGLEHGAGFVLFVVDGKLDFLEGYTYQEKWPGNTDEFQLSYHESPRDWDKLKKKLELP